MLLIAIAVVINAVDEFQPITVEADARHNLAMAYNHFKYGVVCDLKIDNPNITPTY